MDDMELNERLDKIAKGMRTAEATNAVHACRPGHPLGKGEEFPFLNAWFFAARHLGIADPDTEWLHKMARDRNEVDLFNKKLAG